MTFDEVSVEFDVESVVEGGESLLPNWFGRPASPSVADVDVVDEDVVVDEDDDVVVDDEPSVAGDSEPDSAGKAYAIPGVVATADPTPSATAKAPM